MNDLIASFNHPNNYIPWMINNHCPIANCLFTACLSEPWMYKW